MRRTLSVAFLLSLAACATNNTADEYVDPGLSADDETGTEDVLNDDRADAVRLGGGPLAFDEGCTPGERVVIGAAGDLLMHGPLQKQAYMRETHFHTLWQQVEHLTSGLDFMYANFEGPSAPGTTSSGTTVTDPGMNFGVNGVYTSYPQFNYHRQLAEDLVDSGFDIVSTANNHALDRQSIGANRTIDTLDSVGLPYTGTIHSDRANQTWWRKTQIGGISVAWLACTFSTNGIPDRKHQVLGCYSDKDVVLDTISELAARSDIDAVLVTPHWGLEYHAQPERQEVNLAHAMLDAGATAVLGGHPHVLQPWEKYMTADGREAFVIYSFGNFVSGQSSVPKRSTILLMLGLTKSSVTGNVIVNGVSYVPLYMLQSPSWTLQLVDKETDTNNTYAAAYNHITSIFGTENLISPYARPVTTQCPESTPTPWQFQPGSEW